MNRVLLTPRRNFIDCTVNAKTKGNRLMVCDEGRNQKKADRWMDRRGSLLSVGGGAARGMA